MASPLFTIDTNPITGSTAVVAGATVTCTLVDISGVEPVAWEIEGTDESGSPASYAFAQSGSVGQTYSGAALTPGTCATVKCTVNGGIDPATEAPSTTMSARGKFFVPTVDGFEVLSLDEQEDDSRISSATHGCVDPINKAIRGEGLIAAFDGTCAAGGNVVVMDHEVPTDSKLWVEAVALAHDQVNADAACYHFDAVWKNVGGVTSIVGGGSIFTFEEDAAWSFSVSFAGLNARYIFVGDAANDTDISVSFRAKLMRN